MLVGNAEKLFGRAAVKSSDTHSLGRRKPVPRGERFSSKDLAARETASSGGDRLGSNGEAEKLPVPVAMRRPTERLDKRRQSLLPNATEEVLLHCC